MIRPNIEYPRIAYPPRYRAVINNLLIFLLIAAINIGEGVIYKTVDITLVLWVFFAAYLIQRRIKRIDERPSLFSQDCVPIHQNDNFSVDVFIIDHDGMYGLACYDFELREWAFHTDTLVNFKKENKQFWWTYPTFKLSDTKKCIR